MTKSRIESTRSAFLRYRIMAFITGVLLVLLVFVAIPIQTLGPQQGPGVA